MIAYRLDDLVVGHGDEPVCRAPRLEIPAGRITALVGPNGAGKSTLLSALAFLQPPLGGTLRYFDGIVEPSLWADLRREVGWLHQHPYLFDRSVEANVAWGLKARDVPRAQRPARVARALDEVGLDGFEKRRARKLSGGESQRVALARLLALEPRVILLDEPTSHLDHESRERIEAVVLRRVRERGTTVVIAAHDRGQVRRLGAAVWRIRDGVVGPGGPANALGGRIDPDDPDIFVSGPLRIVVHPLPPDTTLVEIHPRDVILAREDHPSSARNHFRGVVTGAEVVDGEVWVTLDCGAPLTAVVTRPSWDALGCTVGSSMVASFKATAVRTA